MKKIRVKSLRGDYEVWTGTSLLEKVGSLVSRLGLQGKAMVVTQERVARFYLDTVLKSFRRKKISLRVYILPDGETAKSQKELFALYHELARHDFERRDVLVALGGGVVGDLTGFAAASYLRGVPFINIATTLLAQVDSAIGGKTGINLTEGKNLVGAFYPPRLVVSDIGVLKTLPDRELRASLGEVVKYGMIRDPGLFKFLERSRDAILRKDRRALERIVEISSRIKAGVVSRDEFEIKGERMILNFGHTFGHGIEQALHYRRLLHGEAVSVGMAFAARLAVELKLFPVSDYQRLLDLLKSFHLPVSLSGLGLKAENILGAMGHDKKKKGGALRFVLPVRIGKVGVRRDIPDRAIRKILIEGGAH